jgi:phosphatidylserine/phosphatidylglycerophosphate/cardiolipin synthase-like enzyme
VRKLLFIAALSALLLPPPCFSADIEVAFSPHGGAEALVLKTIESAKVSIRVAAYGFTSKPISLALLNAHKRGIDVRVVVDKSNATARYTAATFLANLGVPERVDRQYAIMHNKFIVVDGETVETGS